MEVLWTEDPKVEGSDSLSPDFYVDVAQQIEQKTENFRVVGSIPTIHTLFSRCSPTVEAVDLESIKWKFKSSQRDCTGRSTVGRKIVVLHMGVQLPSSTYLSTSGGTGMHFRLKIGRRKD